MTGVLVHYGIVVKTLVAMTNQSLSVCRRATPCAVVPVRRATPLDTPGGTPSTRGALAGSVLSRHVISQNSTQETRV